MNNSNFFLGMQALGGKLYRIRALENWIRTKEGRTSEQWCRDNWKRVRTAIIPEAKIEGSWWRFSSDPKGGRKYAFNEETWSFVDHSDEDIKIQGVIPALVYARGNEVLMPLSECAKVTQVFNYPYGTMSPLPDPILEQNKSKDKGADGVWLWRDLDGAVLFKRVRRTSEQSGKPEKLFVTLGHTCGHWADKNGELVRVEGRQLSLAKMIKNGSPWYGMEKIIQRWGTLKGILIVEGEKSCDKGQEWLDQAVLEDDQTESSWITLTPGPSAMFKNVDMFLLDQLIQAGIEVYIWPDKDSAGVKAATKLQSNEKKMGSIKCWHSVIEYGDYPSGWDVADITSVQEFQDAWKILREQSTGRFEQKLSHQNTLEVPEHGFAFLKGTTQFIHLETMTPYTKDALDMVLREPTGKNRPSIRFIEDDDMKTPFVDNIYGFNHKEGRIYRDEDGTVCINRFSPLKYTELSHEQIDDRALDEEVEWFRAHMDYLIDDEEVQGKFVDWMAFNIQQPGAKIHHATILQGVQGTGKSFIGRCLNDILGKNCYVMPAIDLQRKWNSFFSDVSLVVAEELMKGGRDAKEFSNHVKHLITGETIDVEEKYRAVEKGIRNHVNFMFLTNYEDSIEIDEAEDRYLVHFSSARPESLSYYRHLHSKLEDPSVMQHLFTWFMRRDLRGYSEGSRAFVTNSLRRLKIESLSSWQAQVEFMVNNSLSPFEEGHSVIHVQQLVVLLQNMLNIRSLNRTPVRNYVRSLGYVSTPTDPFVLMPAKTAELAGIATVEEPTPDIHKLLAVIAGKRLTSAEMNDYIQQVYGGTWRKTQLYPQLYSNGWSSKAFKVDGKSIRMWFDGQA